MDNTVNRYLLQNFFLMFISLFGTLFFILSIVFFIQIARITMIVEISFMDLGKLYLFLLPKIFIFTIPVSFFISLALAIFKLSKENEIIVLFTLGYSPKKIGKLFFILSLLFSFSLLIVSIYLIPLSEQLNANFIDYKKTIAKLNIKPTQFGQKFSDWIVFIEKESDNSASQAYENIIMYYLGDDAKRFIISKKAEIFNKDQELSLKLQDGKIYNIEEKSIHQLSYKNMLVKTQNNENIKSINSVFDYWDDILINQKKSKDFLIYVLISIFPTLSVFFAISFGIVTFRYQRGGIYGYIFIILFLFFALTMLLTKSNPFLGIGFLSFVCLSTSIFYFKTKILSRF